MLYIEIQKTPDSETDQITWHVGRPRPSVDAHVVEIQADGDELALIIQRYPIINSGKRVQTFTGTLASNLWKFWDEWAVIA